MKTRTIGAILTLAVALACTRAGATDINPDLNFFGPYAETFSEATGCDLTKEGMAEALAKCDSGIYRYLRHTAEAIGELGWTEFNDRLWKTYSSKPAPRADGVIVMGSPGITTITRLHVLRALLRCGDKRALPEAIEWAVGHEGEQVYTPDRDLAIRNLKYILLAFPESDVSRELLFCALYTTPEECRRTAAAELVEAEQYLIRQNDPRSAAFTEAIDTLAQSPDVDSYIARQIPYYRREAAGPRSYWQNALDAVEAFRAEVEATLEAGGKVPATNFSDRSAFAE